MVTKYKKDIINQQMLLSRVADVAIDIYGMAVVLSRCGDSISNNSASKDLEKKYVQLFCNEAAERTVTRLRDLKSSTLSENISLVTEISDAIIANQGVVHKGPLGF